MGCGSQERLQRRDGESLEPLCKYLWWWCVSLGRRSMIFISLQLTDSSRGRDSGWRLGRLRRSECADGMGRVCRGGAGREEPGDAWRTRATAQRAARHAKECGLHSRGDRQ